jgi:hypothetical protein
MQRNQEKPNRLRIYQIYHIPKKYNILKSALILTVPYSDSEKNLSVLKYFS